MNKTKKFAARLVSVGLLSAGLGIFAGCGDDGGNPTVYHVDPNASSASMVPDDSQTAISSSNVELPPTPESSASVEPPVPLSSEAEVVPQSSAAVEVPPVIPSEGSYLKNPATLGITPDEDGFYYIADVYKAVPTTSKITFVIRHSERQSCESQESKLTEEGIAHAVALGADIGGEEPFYYASTDFIRTRETASNIAKGRGETAEVVAWDAINGGYFLKVPNSEFDDLVGKRGGSWKNLSQFIYGEQVTNAYVAARIADYVYDIMPRGDQFVKEIVLDNLANWKRVNFLVTHDVLIEPLIVYATDRQVDLKFHESQRWANYMAGVAVVVDEAGVTSLFPVRGYEVGWIGPTKSTPTCPEDAAAN